MDIVFHFIYMFVGLIIYVIWEAIFEPLLYRWFHIPSFKAAGYRGKTVYGVLFLDLLAYAWGGIHIGYFICSIGAGIIWAIIAWHISDYVVRAFRDPHRIILRLLTYLFGHGVSIAVMTGLIFFVNNDLPKELVSIYFIWQIVSALVSLIPLAVEHKYDRVKSDKVVITVVAYYLTFLPIGLALLHVPTSTSIMDGIFFGLATGGILTHLYADERSSKNTASNSSESTARQIDYEK